MLCLCVRALSWYLVLSSLYFGTVLRLVVLSCVCRVFRAYRVLCLSTMIRVLCVCRMTSVSHCVTVCRLSVGICHTSESCAFGTAPTFLRLDTVGTVSVCRVFRPVLCPCPADDAFLKPRGTLPSWLRLHSPTTRTPWGNLWCIFYHTNTSEYRHNFQRFCLILILTAVSSSLRPSLLSWRCVYP